MLLFRFTALILFSFLILGAAPALPALSADGSFERLRSSGVVRIGLLKDAPPLCFSGPKGDPVGFDADLARRLGLELMQGQGRTELVLLHASERLPALEEGKVDILLANLTVTPERQNRVLFAEPYLNAFLGALSAKSTPVKTPEALSGKRIAVVQGTAGEAFLTARHPEAEPQPYASQSEAFAALTGGKAEAMVEDALLLAAWARRNPGWTLSIARWGEEEPVAPAVRRQDGELQTRVTAVMHNLWAQHWFASAFQKYIQGYENLGLSQDAILRQRSCPHCQF